MWACLVIVTSTLLAAVCSNEQPTAAVKKTYGGECTVEDDCESGYICSSKLECDCRAGQVISSDKRTCLDTVLFGEACSETAQCRLHLANSACNSTCQCEPGFLHVDSDDHSCVPGNGAMAAQFSVGLVMLACLYSCLLRAEPHTI